MISYLVYLMIYAGAALMVYNIYRYLRFAQSLLHMPGWERERRIIVIPTMLLVMFLFGYLAIALFSTPGPVSGLVLFGGSVFVYLMIMFIERVTHRIQESERLAARLSVAEESNRAKTSFLSTMSHEIRTPLNAIIGLNRLCLNEPDLSPITRERLTKMRSSADHLLALIDDVLDMNRIESGHSALNAACFDLKDLLQQVNDMIGAQCATKGLDYHYEELGALEPAYIGDDTKIRQVLLNVLDNAVKFTPAPGSVRLTAEQSASFGDYRTLRFTIADTGIGIDESFQPRLFKVFTQEDSATTTSYGGTGLGLAITKNLLDMMNGTIQVESQKGVGSTFTLTMTLMACDEQAIGADSDCGCARKAPTDVDAASTVSTATVDAGGASEPGSEPKPTPEGRTEAAGDEARQGLVQSDEGVQEDTTHLEGLRVLIAEDIDINAEILIDLLDLEGIETAHAHNGKEAVELFERYDGAHFDAVLMDVRMPVMDGLAAAKAIRSLDKPGAKDIPIIALSANAFEEDVQNSLQAGMDAHLTKPVDPDELLATIETLIGQQSRH